MQDRAGALTLKVLGARGLDQMESERRAFPCYRTYAVGSAPRAGGCEAGAVGPAGVWGAGRRSPGPEPSAGWNQASGMGERVTWGRRMVDRDFPGGTQKTILLPALQYFPLRDTAGPGTPASTGRSCQGRILEGTEEYRSCISVPGFSDCG